MRRSLSIATVVLLALALMAQAVSAAPLVPISVQGKAATTQSEWEISDLIFYTTVDEDGNPLDPGNRFPEGTETVYAEISFTGLVADDVVIAIWYQDDEELFVQEYTVGEIFESDDIPEDGYIWFSQDFSDLPSTTYTFELYVNDELAIDGSFLIVPAEELTVPPVGGVGNVVTLSQQIPITITIPHPEDPDETISVPVTLTVDLHISLSSTPEVVIEVGQAVGTGEVPPTLTEEQLNYLLTVSDYLFSYGETLTALGDLLIEVGEDDSLLEDEDWLDAVYEQLDTLIALSDEVRALEAPEGFEDVQEELNTAADHFEKAAFLIDEGIQDLDVDAFGDAEEEITLASEALERVTDLLSAWEPVMNK